TNYDNQFPRIDLSGLNIADSVIKFIPKDTAVENNLIPFELEGTFLSVAMIDPTNIVLIDELRFLTGHNIKPYISEFSNIQNALIKHYDIPSEQIAQKSEAPPVQQSPAANKPPEQQQRVQKSEPEPQPAPSTVPQPQSFSEPPQPAPQQQEPAAAAQQPTSSAPPDEPQAASPADFRPAAESKEQQAPQQPQFDEPKVAEQPKAEEEQSTQNEITDVFTKDDDNYIKGVKEVEVSSFENISLQSSDSSNNLFQTPEQSQPAPDQAVTKQPDAPDSSDNLFQAPTEQAQTQVGFQPVETPAARQPKEPEKPEEQPVVPPPSPAPDSSQDLNVFASSQTASDADEDKTIELSVEAEEITDEKSRLNEAQDISDMPDQAQGSEAQSAELSASSDNASSDASSGPGLFPDPADVSKDIEDLFKIPGQQDSTDVNTPTVTPESDLRSLNEDASYNTIESFNKNIDSNGSQPDTTVTSEPPPKPELKEAPHVAEVPGPQVSEPVSPVEQGEPEAASPKPTVLLVDDSPTVQKIVSVTLSRQGYQVEVSSNAMQALAKLNELIPDIIFLDINLPHMDGYQLCKIIKGNELTKEVPVIMLSGKDGFFDKMRGKMVGATDYITKPFEPNSLVTAIKKQGITSTGAM
ncbi:MAG: response regulator, partial [Candidatus Dadabacteria bacterium]|nr:response regulator [Candidatus Dadabacteria bacterium]NIS08656.1 response regulator [Candidatus Dadabacteria bacterium]NIV42490.1 response regulator [Candidatus Dadabacteria bacterium]NIX15372.1 response regulator [Candidatus Dadabacteria bacterium]NIY22031.1 response regulator [Candidatus Dadabacteria bacterium]